MVTVTGQIPWLRVCVESVVKKCVVVTPVLVLVLGCSRDGASVESLTVRDSAGVRIVESRVPEWSAGVSGWTVDPLPELEIRGDFAEPDHYLFRVGHVVRMADRRIVVGNGGTSQIFLFDSLGSFVGAEGGPGDGPGEFQRLEGLFRCQNDDLVVRERSRLSVLDPDAKFLRTVRTVGTLAETPRFEAISSDCSAALFVGNVPRPPFTPGVTERSRTLYWSPLEGGSRDTVATVVALRLYVWEENGEVEAVEIPFQAQPTWTHSPQDEIFLGLAQGFEVRVLGRDGGLLEVIRWAYELEPVTSDELSSFAEEVRLFLQEHPSEGRFWAPLEDLPIADYKPAYSRLLVDDQGLLWVQQFGRWSLYGPGPSDQWWVFDTSGRWLGAVVMPPDLTVLAVEKDFVIGVFLDALDVQNIRLHRLNRDISP